jgi:hypothetical protein
VALERVSPGDVISLPASTALALMRVAALVDSNPAGSGAAGYAAGTATALLGGICNKPAGAGEGAEIQIGGVARLVAGAAINVGDKVGSQTDGFAIAVTGAATAYVGIALTKAAGSANVFECLIQPGWV